MRERAGLGPPSLPTHSQDMAMPGVATDDLQLRADGRDQTSQADRT